MSQHIQESHQLLEQWENLKLEPVLVESPLSAPTLHDWVLHKKYARFCMRDCLNRGEAPFASHLLYAQEGLLNDFNAEERALGIHAGLIWGKFAQRSIVYTDFGVSSGMEKGIQRAQKEGKKIEYRTLGFIPSLSHEEIELEQKRRVIEEQINKIEMPLKTIFKLR